MRHPKLTNAIGQSNMPALVSISLRNGSAMPAPVVLVHNDPEFLETAKASLEAAGFVVASFSSPMLALTALETPHTVNLLITGNFFGPGQPNAVSLNSRRAEPAAKRASGFHRRA